MYILIFTVITMHLVVDIKDDARSVSSYTSNRSQISQHVKYMYTKSINTAKANVLTNSVFLDKK